MTRLFACKLLEDAAFERLRPAMMSSVPEATAKKAANYYHANDTQRHLIGELLARYALHHLSGSKPNDPFITGEKGKPHPDGFNGVHFNVSHSGSWVVVATSTAQVGVDVERIRKTPEGVAYRFFSEGEKEMLDMAENEIEKAHIFFTLWTLKESFLKAIGKGLSKSLSTFSVQKTLNGDYILQSDPETNGFHLKTYSFDEGYKLAACATDALFDDKVLIIEAASLI